MSEKRAASTWDWSCVQPEPKTKRQRKPKALTAEQQERKRKTAVAYVRTGADYEKDIGTQGQLGAIREFCERRGFSLVAVVEELDCPGHVLTADRPSYPELLRVIEQEGAGALVLWRPDRLSNDMAEAGAAAGQLQQAFGVICYSATDPVHTDGPQNALMFAILAAFEPRNPDQKLWE